MGPNKASSRVLYIHSSPLIDLRNKPYITDVDILNCSAEKKIISDAIRDSNLNICFRSIIATVQNLSDAIMAGATMIHYAGHGERKAISFETKYAEIYAMDVKTLRSLLEASKTASRTKIVVVSACHSEEAGKTFIEAGIPHVVAVRREHRLTDKASHIFTKSFYNALLLNRSVQTAFDIAVSTVSAITGSDFGDEFILLPINGNHAESVFDDVDEGEYEIETKMNFVNLCDCPPSNFIDRCRVMQEIYRHYVDSHRCVTLQGLRGSGKTALALRSAVFIAERDLFDFIFYVPFERSRESIFGKGDRGDKGYNGEKGDKSEKGERGEKVDKGEKGEKIGDKSSDKTSDKTYDSIKIPKKKDSNAVFNGKEVNINVLVNIIALSMREYGTGIDTIEKLLDFLSGSDSRIRPRVLFIFDGCDIFLSGGSGNVPAVSVKPMSYKNVLQNNTNNNNNNSSYNNNITYSNSTYNNNNSSNNSSNNNRSQSFDRPYHDPSTSNTTHTSQTPTPPTTSPALRELVDSMLRRSDTVRFLSLMSSKTPLFGLLSQEHEKIVNLLPFNDNDSADFFVKISSPKCLKLPDRETLLFPLSQMRFLGALQGNPKAIGTFALFLDNCCASNNPNLPVRDTDFWVRSAGDIYREVVSESYEKGKDGKDGRDENCSEECERVERNDRIDRKDENKDKDKDKEKEKEKVYDFNETPGYERKTNNKNRINFGLLSSQLPSTTVPVKTIPTPVPLPSSSLFLSSLPLPPPLSLLSLKRSQIVANTFLLSTPCSPPSKEDLLSHITFWAELTATHDKPYVPRTYAEWNTFMPKLEFLLFQILSVHFQFNPPEESEKNIGDNKNSEKLKNVSLRKFSSTEFNFLKKKIKLEFLPTTLIPAVTQLPVGGKSVKNVNVKENDDKLIITLPSFSRFLLWWLPLLLTLRKVKYEFCSVISSSTSSADSCSLVLGFIDRTQAVELLIKAGESGVFLLRFSDSKPGQIAISHTDFKTQDTTESNGNYGIIVSHCLVDIALDGYVLSLANTERKYDTLKELLTDCKKLKKFYPNTPKTTAFQYLDRLQQVTVHR